MGIEDINVDDLKKWKQSTKLNVEGVKLPVTVLHDEPLPTMDLFISKSDKQNDEQNDEQSKKDYEKRRIIDWIKEWSKREYEFTDGQNEKLKVYFPKNPETEEKRATLYIEDTKFGSLTKGNYILLRLELDRWFGMHKLIPRRKEGTILRSAIREKYGIDLILMLAEKDTITTQEFADKINSNDQYTGRRLNKFAEIGLLDVHKCKIGGVKVFKSGIREEKLREIADIFG